MLKPFLMTGLILLAFGSHAFADELNLACVTENAKARRWISRQVIVGQSDRPVALRGQDGSVRRLKTYAVVIEIIPGHGNRPAGENWEVLSSREFQIQTIAGIPEEGPSWRFFNRKTGDVLLCGQNLEVRANPALTRTN